MSRLVSFNSLLAKITPGVDVGSLACQVGLLLTTSSTRTGPSMDWNVNVQHNDIFLNSV